MKNSWNNLTGYLGKHPWPILILIIIFGSVLRLYQIGRESLWFDELFPLWASRLPLRELLIEVPASGHPPLYYLIGHLVFAISTNDIWIRMISLTAGIVTIPIMYLLGRELFSKKTGLWTASLAAASPILVWYSREATDYSLLIALSAVSILFLARSVNRGGAGNCAGYVIATMAALFTHYYAFFLIPAEIPFFFLVAGDWRKFFKSWLVSQAILFVLLIPWFLYNQWASRWIAYNRPDPIVAIKGIFHGIPILFGGRIPLNHGDLSISHVSLMYLALSLFMLAAFFMLTTFSPEFRKNFLTKKTVALLIMIAILITGPVISQLMRDNFLSIRFYTPAATAFILLTGSFIGAARRWSAAFIGTVLVATMIFLTSWTLSVYHFDNWRDVIGTIADNSKQGDGIFCVPLSTCVMATDHYLPVEIPISGGGMEQSRTDEILFKPAGTLWSGYRNSEKYGKSEVLSGDALRNRIQSDLGGTKRVWLISGDGTTIDMQVPTGVISVIEEGWTEKQVWTYPPLSLRLYER
jgi:uncharacterized membrane protein